jgi:hypothetical protein
LLGVGFRLGELDVGLDVTGQAGKLRMGGELVFGALTLLQNVLRLFLIVPKVGIRDALLEILYPRSILVRVKDSSVRDGCAGLFLHIDVRGLQESFW